MKERVTFRGRWVGALQKFQNKLGLINGLDDPISGQVMVDRYEEIISKERIWKLEQIGHYPQVEVPDLLMNDFEEFHEKVNL